MQITVTKQSNGDKRAFAAHWSGAEWVKGVEGIERILYNLPEVAERVSLGGTITVVEGEKDADTLNGIGITTTTNPFGAGKWLDPMSEVLTGARVAIIPDLDEAGTKHAAMVKTSLNNAGVASVGILNLRSLMPDLPDKSDVSDYLERGGDPEVLRRAIEAACVDVEPNNEDSIVHTVPTIDATALPPTFADLLGSIEDDRQRIALLMAALTVIGAILPGVRTQYFGQWYSPALYLFVVGPPGSGKGSIGPAELLISSIDDVIRRESIEDLKAYKKEYAFWKMKGLKAGLPPPDKPDRKMLLVPADSTGPVLIRAICTNPCVLTFDTEADSLQSAFRVETGDAGPAARKAWQGERVSQARVADDLLVSTDRPHFSMVLSGTPDQIPVLVKHVATGLTSRIGFIEFPEQTSFRDPFKTGRDRAVEVAKSMRHEICNLWRFVRGHADEVGFSVELAEQQQQWLYEHYKKRFEDKIEGADQGTTLRSGIVAVRIMTVLTVVRGWFTHHHLDPVMTVNDDDFKIGLELAEYLRLGTDSIINRLSAHTSFKTLPNTKRKSQVWFDQLPAEFTTQDALDVGMKVGIKRASVFSMLKQTDDIEHLAHGRYRKRKAPHARGP
ncbi:MAG: DUF3987 domain-containing protein [Ignavibacteria bacterium]|nr:DUF3987 domain-containing protein [Ignavibacteria bacterium]